jgi:hypothetical protein
MITVDWLNKIVDSTSSILDLPAFKDTIRDLEDDALGILYPPVISYKKLDLGGGAYFHAVELINGYQLRFPVAGSYTIVGNLGGTIVAVAGVYVERKTSAAFATAASGGSGGLTIEQERKLDELWRLTGADIANPLYADADMIQAGDITINLTGTPGTFTQAERQP